jgi:hypothetical protein
MKLTVFLGQDASDSFDIGLINNQFTNKWLDELSWCLENCEFDHNETFLYFEDIEQRKVTILTAINNINQYMKKIYKKNFIEIPAVIDWKKQDFFNELHVKFEKLCGTWSNPTRLYQLAPSTIRENIRQLNGYVHGIENPYFNELFKVSFNKDQYRRQKLDKEDYKFFNHAVETGDFYIAYSELGKSWLDLYNDGLDVSYAATKNLHYFSGEAYLYFGEDYTYPEDFYKWCTDNSLNPYDKTQGIGEIKIGKVKNPLEVKNILKNNQYLHSIKIER